MNPGKHTFVQSLSIFFFFQSFNTSRLEAVSIGLQGTELDGVSYATYRDQMSALALYEEQLNNLYTSLITIRSTLDGMLLHYKQNPPKLYWNDLSLLVILQHSEY